MTWRLDGPQMNEAQKVLWDLIPFTRGLGVDLGCGGSKAYNHFIGVDNLTDTKLFGTPMQPDVVVKTCEKLDLFASGSFDFVFSSHLLEHISDYKAALREWWRLIRPEGHLVLYLPHKDLYPRIGTKEEKEEWEEWAKKYQVVEGKIPAKAIYDLANFRETQGKKTIGEQYAGTPGSNQDHKHDFSPEDITEAMKGLGGWDLVESEIRNEDNEYSFFQVYKKLKGNKQSFSHKAPKPEKTCAVVRYGAYGDLMMASSIFSGLKKQGYHLTLYTVPRGWEAIREDPSVDRVILQDTDQVPPAGLGMYWAHIKKKYDKFVNLSESVEGTLLAMGDRIQGTWPTALRHKMLDVNYLDFHHDLAEVEEKPFHLFYATAEEREWAKAERAKMGGFVVLWSLAGSSVHKSWPHMDTIFARVLLLYPDANIVTVGDNMAQILESGWENEPRVLRRSGIWSIRQSMSFIEEADLVIGPETGVLNAAGFSKTPKICLLSHSSANNLTRDWVNCTALEPENTPCYPCHMMHYGFQHCKPGYMDINGESTRVGALCQVNIVPDRMWEAIQFWKQKQRKAA